MKANQRFYDDLVEAAIMNYDTLPGEILGSPRFRIECGHTQKLACLRQYFRPMIETVPLKKPPKPTRGMMGNEAHFRTVLIAGQ
jgi:hypothetical protein